LVLLVAILYLVVSLQQVAVVVAKVPTLPLLMVDRAAGEMKEIQAVLVILLALHHHKATMVVVHQVHQVVVVVAAQALLAPMLLEK